MSSYHQAIYSLQQNYLYKGVVSQNDINFMEWMHEILMNNARTLISAEKSHIHNIFLSFKFNDPDNWLG